MAAACGRLPLGQPTGLDGRVVNGARDYAWPKVVFALLLAFYRLDQKTLDASRTFGERKPAEPVIGGLLE